MIGDVSRAGAQGGVKRVASGGSMPKTRTELPPMTKTMCNNPNPIQSQIASSKKQGIPTEIDETQLSEEERMEKAEQARRLCRFARSSHNNKHGDEIHLEPISAVVCILYSWAGSVFYFNFATKLRNNFEQVQTKLQFKSVEFLGI